MEISLRFCELRSEDYTKNYLSAVTKQIKTPKYFEILAQMDLCLMYTVEFE